MSGRDTVFNPSTTTNPGGASSGQGGLWHPNAGAPGGFSRDKPTKYKIAAAAHTAHAAHAAHAARAVTP